MNKDLLKAAVEAREHFAKTTDTAYVSFECHGRYDEKQIAYVVFKNHWYYGAGYAVFDGAHYVATFSDAVLDVFKIGLAGTQPATSASAQTQEDTVAGSLAS